MDAGESWHLNRIRSGRSRDLLGRASGGKSRLALKRCWKTRGDSSGTRPPDVKESGTPYQCDGAGRIDAKVLDGDMGGAWMMRRNGLKRKQQFCSITLSAPEETVHWIPETSRSDTPHTAENEAGVPNRKMARKAVRLVSRKKTGLDGEAYMAELVHPS